MTDHKEQPEAMMRKSKLEGGVWNLSPDYRCAFKPLNKELNSVPVAYWTGQEWMYWFIPVYE